MLDDSMARWVPIGKLRCMAAFKCASASFTIRLFECADMERLGELCETIAAQCNHRHLQELDVSIRQSAPVTFVHPGNIFRPLYQFTDLRTIWIGVPDGYDLDDVALSDMARAWPHVDSRATESVVVLPRLGSAP
ncbi:hypothetical protein DFH06DRAFT_1359590 [Mycena polygramma]|nr:hypothetical protein DFH06DRAFT_1359590 [Mycena polygramma]